MVDSDWSIAIVKPSITSRPVFHMRMQQKLSILFINIHEQIKTICGGRRDYYWPFLFGVNVPVKYFIARANPTF